MLNTVQYRVAGNEKRNDDGWMIIPVHPSSGLKMYDVLINGLDYVGGYIVDEEKGLLYMGVLLVRGDLVQIIYKTIPRWHPDPDEEFTLAFSDEYLVGDETEPYE